MPGFYLAPLPQFRTGDPIDFSGISNALTGYLDMQRSKAIGNALQSGMSSQQPQTFTQPDTNALLRSYGTPASPAQGAAAAAGRDYPPMYGSTPSPAPAAAGRSPTGVIANQAENLGLRSGANADLVTISSPSGAKFTVARSLAPQYQGFINDLEKSGYAIDGSQSGGYNDRTIVGSNRVSQHAYGNAVDINWNANPRNGTPGTMPSSVGDLASKWGLTWGGNFSNPDPMHFEASRIVNTPSGPVAAPAAPQNALMPVSAPAQPPSNGGMNYAAAARVAFDQGNIGLGTQLMEMQRQAVQDQQKQQLTGMQIQSQQNELEQQFNQRAGLIANTIQSAPADQQAAMWQRFLGTHPEMANTLQAHGVDPTDVKAGTDFFLNQARGILPIQKPTLTKIGVDQYGHDIMGVWDPNTQKATPLAQSGVTGQSGAGAASGAPLRGEQALGQYPALIADKARNILAGREKLPAATRGDPTALATAEAVRNADPTYNSNRFHYREQWENPNGNVGKTRIANNTAIGHMGELDQLIDKLPDSWHGPGGQTANALRNWWQGNHTDPTLSQWAANSKLLADEIVKVATGAGAGAVGDREEVLSTLNPANGRTALKATLEKYVHIMASKTEALAHDRDRVMGPAAEGMDVIDEANKPVLDRLIKRYGGGTQVAKPSGMSDEQIISEASKAIQNGKDPEAVKEQLKAWGINLQ